MPVFDTSDNPVNPNRFAEKLVGAMCEVTFTLRHYAIRGHKNSDGKWIDPNDVFSAQVESVAILTGPPVLVRSPYKGRLTRRPHHKPQIPTRGEQVNSALAFIPRLDYGLVQPTLPTQLPGTNADIETTTTTASTVFLDNSTTLGAIPNLADAGSCFNTGLEFAVPVIPTAVRSDNSLSAVETRKKTRGK